MIFVLYSGDYEVFLGGNYRPEREVMIERAERMLAACEEIGVPLTLFADLCCLWRYRELGHQDFPKEVDDQMCRAVRRGHDVQVHIHPHWLKAEITRKPDGSSHYQFDPSTLALGTIGGDVYGQTLDMVRRAKTYLADLLSPVDPKYRCIAYRAGGYGIQPDTEAIFAALEDAGLVIDSSIVPGLQVNHRLGQLDFTAAPQAGNYYVSREHGLRRDAGRGLFEIPIVAGRLTQPFDRLRCILRGVRRHLWKKTPDALPGYTVAHKWPTPKNSFAWRVRHFLFQAPWRLLDINLDPGEMLDLTRSYIDRYHRQGTDLYFSFSGHPKDVTPSNLEGMKKYHRGLKRRYGSSLEAITFQDAARRLPPEARPGSPLTEMVG